MMVVGVEGGWVVRFVFGCDDDWPASPYDLRDLPLLVFDRWFLDCRNVIIRFGTTMEPPTRSIPPTLLGYTIGLVLFTQAQ